MFGLEGFPRGAMAGMIRLLKIAQLQVDVTLTTGTPPAEILRTGITIEGSDSLLVCVASFGWAKTATTATPFINMLLDGASFRNWYQSMNAGHAFQTTAFGVTRAAPGGHVVSITGRNDGGTTAIRAVTAANEFLYLYLFEVSASFDGAFRP